MALAAEGAWSRLVRTPAQREGKAPAVPLVLVDVSFLPVATIDGVNDKSISPAGGTHSHLTCVLGRTVKSLTFAAHPKPSATTRSLARLASD
jgi:hypothetical protein